MSKQTRQVLGDKQAAQVAQVLQPIQRQSPEPARSSPDALLERHRDPRWLVPTLALFAVATTVKFGIRPVSDPDAWWHLKTGAYVLSRWQLNGPDPWVPFSSRPFVLTQWLPEVVAQKGYELFGLPAVAWLRCAAMLALISALVWAARQAADSVPAIIAALAAFVGTGGSLSERPQLVSLVLLAVTVGAWWRTAGDLRPRWWLAPMTFLWACSHGLWGVGVLIGLAVVAGLALDRRLDRHTALRLLAVPGLSIVAAALTPVGPRLLLTPLEVSSNASQFVQEWQPTDARSLFAAVTLGMIALALLPWIRGTSARPWWQITLAGTAVVFTLAMMRTVPVGSIIAAPLLASSVQQQRGHPPAPLTRRGRSAWVALVTAAAIVAVPITAAVAQRPSGWPEGLRPKLDAIPARTVVLNDFTAGGWLLWREPQLRPVIDLRSEIYSTEYIRDYIRAEQVRPGWQTFLGRTKPTYALLRHNAPLTVALLDQLRWKAVGKGGEYILLKAP
ncbi:MAG: hypothetical protein QOF35_523 [Actinomycetota bacterium]|jgi:hypothetical protein|nr:hypothetical protein [Actinomycetota bacterium]